MEIESSSGEKKPFTAKEKEEWKRLEKDEEELKKLGNDLPHCDFAIDYYKDLCDQIRDALCGDTQIDKIKLIWPHDQKLTDDVKELLATEKQIRRQSSSSDRSRGTTTLGGISKNTK